MNDYIILRIQGDDLKRYFFHGFKEAIEFFTNTVKKYTEKTEVLDKIKNCEKMKNCKNIKFNSDEIQYFDTKVLVFKNKDLTIKLIKF